MERIKAVLTEVKYPDAEKETAERETGKTRLFYVLNVNYEGNTLRAVGESAFRPNVNAVYALTGEWYAWNGLRQFRFRAIEELIPMDSRGLLFYTCAQTKGFGEATAELIWDTLGENWPSIGECDVPRVTNEKVQALMATLERLQLHQAMTEAVVWLLGKGCTQKMAEAAWEKWGLATVPTVNANCYALADLPRYGFRSVDMGIRQSFGITDNDYRRIDACISYTFGQLTERGDTIVRWADFWEAICNTLQNVPSTEVYARVGEAFRSEKYMLFDATNELTSTFLYGIEAAIWQYAGERQ